jgi:DNA polymerase-3 subunit alpha
MCFATLDDVEGQVEMLVMGKAYEGSVEFLAADAIVVVRGRLDHKGRGDTKLVAQEVELFEPTEDEVAKARRARGSEALVIPIDAGAFATTLIDDLKSVLENFPGEAEVMLEMQTREGMRKLRFGEGYRVRRSAALDAELHALLGSPAQAA